MSIPPEIEKEIDEIKPNSAGTKILVRCLIGAILAMGGVIVYLSKGGSKNMEAQVGIYKQQLVTCQTVSDKKDTEISRLNNYIIQEAQEDIRRERKNEDNLNAIIDKYKTLLK
jgi:uncharacterized protein HemX